MTRLLAWLGDIGADPNDDVETRKRKALLVYLAVLILPISLLWGVLYLALGAPAGVVAFVYFAVSAASIGLFARTGNFELLLRIQLLAITLAPTLSMFPTGGFLASGGVGLWGILGPLGALVFSTVRASVGWFVLFAVAFLAAGLGVIGRKRFLYDLWGDAVNTAGRMQTEGTPGRIQITHATYELVKDEFVCEPRGSVPVKGKGEMETWYLVRKREAMPGSYR